VGWSSPNASTQCADIDECAAVNPCSERIAACNNSAGSFQCVCNKGYRGNGSVTCLDVDECSDAGGGGGGAASDCHVNATCQSMWCMMMYV
jgi:hypothetical protein